MQQQRRVFPFLLLLLAAAAACGAGPVDAPSPPRITFASHISAITRSAIGMSFPLEVSVSGTDPSRQLLWASRDPSVVAIDSSASGGRVVWFHGVRPGPTFLVLTVIGRTVVVDSVSMSVNGFP